MKASNLLLLVGSNPLPNYLAIQLLQPSTVWLLYTDQTKDVEERLKAAITRLDNAIRVKEHYIPSAWEAAKIQGAFKELCQELPQGVHLHYTGGTKAMSVHIYQMWKDLCKGAPGNASYMDDHDAMLRFDDGTEDSLENPQIRLDIQTLAHLAGIQNLKVRFYGNGDPTPADTQAIAKAVFGEERTELPGDLYEATHSGEPKRKKTQRQLRDKPIVLADFSLELTAKQCPDVEWDKARIEAWRDFLAGGWLEEWVAQCVTACGLGLTPDVSVTGTRGKVKRPFELDVAAIRNHRLYAISCTTSTATDLCKSKLFEVGHRARQLGGDLAHFALVGFPKTISPEALEADLDADWGYGGDSPNKLLRVFGLTHLKEWHKGDLSILKTWLNS